MKLWLTVAEAAVLIGKHERTIYRWVRKGTLFARTAVDGSLEVRSADVTKVEAVTRRGRPRGTATRRR